MFFGFFFFQLQKQWTSCLSCTSVFFKIQRAEACQAQCGLELVPPMLVRQPHLPEEEQLSCVWISSWANSSRNPPQTCLPVSFRWTKSHVLPSTDHRGRNEITINRDFPLSWGQGYFSEVRMPQWKAASVCRDHGFYGTNSVCCISLTLDFFFFL